MSTRPSPPPAFIDLDECLIYAHESVGNPPARPSGIEEARIGDYEVWLRPEARGIVQVLRANGREVYLFTMSTFGFAEAVSGAFRLGFTERTIFSMAMVLNCRRGLCPRGVLIDNLPPAADNTRAKMEALGIGPSRVWVIPAFEPPRFASAKLFLMGLSLRLARLDGKRAVS